MVFTAIVADLEGIQIVRNKNGDPQTISCSARMTAAAGAENSIGFPTVAQCATLWGLIGNKRFRIKHFGMWAYILSGATNVTPREFFRIPSAGVTNYVWHDTVTMVNNQAKSWGVDDAPRSYDWGSPTITIGTSLFSISTSALVINDSLYVDVVLEMID